MFEVGDKIWLAKKGSIEEDSLCAIIKEVTIKKVNKKTYSIDHFTFGRETIKNIAFDDLSENLSRWSWQVVPEELIEKYQKEERIYREYNSLRNNISTPYELNMIDDKIKDCEIKIKDLTETRDFLLRRAVQRREVNIRTKAKIEELIKELKNEE